jgi:hypothetical protein
VNRDGTIVCRVTGRCQRQFICANEYRIETNDLYQPIATQGQEFKHSKRADSVPSLSHDNIRTEVEKYVRLLLYSNTRNDISSECGSKPLKKKAKRHYKKRRKVSILQFEKTIFNEICQDVSSTIITLMGHNRSTKLKPLIIALLFLKQHGKAYKTKTQEQFIIKRSEYLYENLPSVSDLHLFSVQKNLIRIGSNTIQKIVRNI